MAHNITLLKTSTNTAELFSYANFASDYTLFGALMIGIFFIMLYILKKWPFEQGFVVSCLACFLLSSFLTYIKLLNFMFPLVFLILTGLSVLFIFVVRRG